MKYWAFISYSHADEAWAQWLHRSIETWRVPRRLVGRPLGGETIPARLFPVFRDRDELPSSHELGAVINRALADSRNLVVICSPRAATSRWVNEEIKAFRALDRGNRVFCLIVDGEPHASQRPDIAFTECFPPALRDGGFEPIAADARPRKDGKEGARLKLLAGLLDLGLDELRQREKQRQFRQRIFNALGALAVIAALAGTVQWFVAQRAAREREIQVGQLVEKGRVELLEGRPARAAVALNEARLQGGDTAPVRFMLGRAMQTVDSLTPVRIRHGGSAVKRVVFSPDGQRFVLLVESGGQVTGKVYEAASGRLLESFRDVPRHPRVARYIRDDLLLVSGYAEQTRDAESGPTMAVWRSGREQPVLVRAGTSGRAGTPATPDGGTLAIATESGVLMLRTADGSPITTLQSGRSFTATSFSADGKRLATADSTGRVEVWSAAALQAPVQLKGLDGQHVIGLEFTADGQRVLALSASGDIRIWDLASASLVVAFGADPRWVAQLALSSNGRRLLTVGSEGYKVWSAARGILLFDLRTWLYRDASAAMSADGNYLYTADTTASVSEVWAVRSRTRLYTLDLHSDSATAVALDPSDAHVVLASEDGTASVWRTDATPRWGADTAGILAPFRVAFGRSDSELLLAGGSQGAGNVLLLDWTTGESKVRFGEHRALVKDAALDVQRDRLLTAGLDGVGAIWSPSDGRRIGAVAESLGPLHLAGMNAQGTRGVFISERPAGAASAVLVDPRTGATVAALHSDHFITGFAFSPDGARLATVEVEGQLRLWNTNDGKLLATDAAHRGGSRSIVFDKSGLRLLSAGADQAVRIWDAMSLQPLTSLQDPSLGTVFQALWAPDELTIAIATEVGTIWIWDLATGERRALKGHQSAVASLQYLGTGEVLLSRGFDGTVRAWDPAAGLELAVVASLGDELTPMALNGGETLLAAGAVNWQVGIWNIAPESRTAEDVAARLACGSPWIIDGAALLPRAIDIVGCGKKESAGGVSPPAPR